MTPEQARDLTDRLRLYAQPQRLTILSTLHDGPLTVGEIEARTGVRQPALSQQLGALRRAGILAAARDARAVRYGFADGIQQRRAATLLALFRPTPGPDGDATVLRPRDPTAPGSGDATAPGPGDATARPAVDRLTARLSGDGAAFARVVTP